MDRQGLFRKRLAEVVRWVFDGNVKRAADRLRVSQPTLHKILSGQIQESKSSTIAELADRLGVGEAWLRGDAASPDPFAKERAPLWLELNRLYVRRQQAQLWDAIYRAGPPKDDKMQELIQAVEEHGGFFDQPTQRFMQAYGEAVERDGIYPAEDLAALFRATAEAELAILRLVAELVGRPKGLKRSGPRMPRTVSNHPTAENPKTAK